MTSGEWDLRALKALEEEEQKEFLALSQRNLFDPPAPPQPAAAPSGQPQPSASSASSLQALDANAGHVAAASSSLSTSSSSSSPSLAASSHLGGKAGNRLTNSRGLTYAQLHPHLLKLPTITECQFIGKPGHGKDNESSKGRLKFSKVLSLSAHALNVRNVSASSKLNKARKLLSSKSIGSLSPSRSNISPVYTPPPTRRCATLHHTQPVRKTFKTLQQLERQKKEREGFLKGTKGGGDTKGKTFWKYGANSTAASIIGQRASRLQQLKLANLEQESNTSDELGSEENRDLNSFLGFDIGDLDDSATETGSCSVPLTTDSNDMLRLILSAASSAVTTPNPQLLPPSLLNPKSEMAPATSVIEIHNEFAPSYNAGGIFEQPKPYQQQPHTLQFLNEETVAYEAFQVSNRRKSFSGGISRTLVRGNSLKGHTTQLSPTDAVMNSGTQATSSTLHKRKMLKASSVDIPDVDYVATNIQTLHDGLNLADFTIRTKFLNKNHDDLSHQAATVIKAKAAAGGKCPGGMAAMPGMADIGAIGGLEDEAGCLPLSSKASAALTTPQRIKVNTVKKQQQQHQQQQQPLPQQNQIQQHLQHQHQQQQQQQQHQICNFTANLLTYNEAPKSDCHLMQHAHQFHHQHQHQHHPHLYHSQFAGVLGSQDLELNDVTVTSHSNLIDDELEQHIKHCSCSCNHMGYGNSMDYQTTGFGGLPDVTEHSNIRRTLSRQNSVSNSDSGGEIASIQKSKSSFGSEAKAPASTSASSAEKRKTKDAQQNTNAVRHNKHARRNSCILAFTMVIAICLLAIAATLAYQHFFMTPSRNSHTQRLRIVRRILREVPLVDGHNNFAWNVRKYAHSSLELVHLSHDLDHQSVWSRPTWAQTDMERLKQGLVGVQVWSAYVPCEAQGLDAVQLALEQIDIIRRLSDMYHQETVLVTSSKDITTARKEGLMASMIGVEGGHAMGSSLGVLRSFYSLGARYLSLTHKCDVTWAGSSASPFENGLTQFGKAVIREMNRLGMMIDLSYSSDATARDVLEATRAPVIFSHSAARQLCNSTRNIPDDILRLVAENGGLIMISFDSEDVACGRQAHLKDVIDHIQYIRSVAGIQHIGLGAGYDGIEVPPVGLEDVSKYPDLLASLLEDHNWSEEDIGMLAGRNFLRIMETVENVRDFWKRAAIQPIEESEPLPKSQCTWMSS